MKTTGLNDLLHSTNDACKVINKDSLFSLVILKKHACGWAILVSEIINLLEPKQCINKQDERFR
jgi:hypothetical protein